MIGAARLRWALPHLAMLGVAGLLWWAARLIDTDAAGAGGRIGPDFWPKAIIVFLAGLCAWESVMRLFVRRLERPDAAGVSGAAAVPGPAAAAAAGPLDSPAASAAAAPGGSDTGSRHTGSSHTGSLLAGMASIVGYAILVDWIGFFISTALFLAVFIRIGGLRRALLSIAIGLAGSFLLVVMFMRVAYISLPLGAGPFRDLSLALLRLIGVS